jgi:hypothetical protein
MNYYIYIYGDDADDDAHDWAPCILRIQCFYFTDLMKNMTNLICVFIDPEVTDAGHRKIRVVSSEGRERETSVDPTWSVMIR